MGLMLLVLSGSSALGIRASSLVLAAMNRTLAMVCGSLHLQPRSLVTMYPLHVLWGNGWSICAALLASFSRINCRAKARLTMETLETAARHRRILTRPCVHVTTSRISVPAWVLRPPLQLETTAASGLQGQTRRSIVACARMHPVRTSLVTRGRALVLQPHCAHPRVRRACSRLISSQRTTFTKLPSLRFSCTIL